MKTIPHLHDLFGSLPESIREELAAVTTPRHFLAGEPVYRQGDEASEMYQVIAGCVRLCNFSYDGKEVELSRFRPGDCFGEMALIDGLTRVSYAIAVKATELRVLAKEQFDTLYYRYPEFSQQLNLMLCRRMRMLYSFSEETCALSLKQRLARHLCRLAYNQGFRDQQHRLCIEVSHEELGRNLVASRQSISKELKVLELEGGVALRYGRIHIEDLNRLQDEYESLMGAEQVTATYEGQ